MTHFRCAVFSYDPDRFEDLLAPYSETDRNYYEFVKATRTEEQLKEDWKEYKRKSHKATPFEKFLNLEGYKIVDGVIGYYANPNAKWDWYSLNGGAWMFDFKYDEGYDENGNAKKNQFSYVDKNFSYSHYRKLYDEFRENAVSQTVSEYLRKEAIDILAAYPTVEEFIADKVYNVPYAFITPDGVWHAPGNIGWFASSDDTPESFKAYYKEWVDYIESDEDPYVNFVDCHI